MAKSAKGELPYFKFQISAWNGGDILQCSLTAQGLFINLCALYWGKHGNLSYSKMLKKFPRKQKHFAELLTEGVVKLSEDKLVISFLDEQLKDRGAVSTKNADNANTRWNANKSDAVALPSQNDRTTVAPHLEEKREEEKREEEKREEVCVILTDEALNLIDGLCEYFHVKPITSSILYDTVCQYVSTVMHRNELQIAAMALKNYMAYKKLSQEQRHSINSWIGSIDEHFKDGQWIMMDWDSKLKTIQNAKFERGAGQISPTAGKDYSEGF